MRFRAQADGKSIFSWRVLKRGCSKSNKTMNRRLQKKTKAYCTDDSQAVSDPSTKSAQRCLTCQIGRDGVCSTWYGRRRNSHVSLQRLCSGYSAARLCSKRNVECRCSIRVIFFPVNKPRTSPYTMILANRPISLRAYSMTCDSELKQTENQYFHGEF